MEPLYDVVRVTPRSDHTLELEFENGETRLFDMAPFLVRKPFDRLARSPVFLKARVAHGTVVWPGNIDIAPDTLWSLSRPMGASTFQVGEPIATYAGRARPASPKRPPRRPRSRRSPG